MWRFTGYDRLPGLPFHARRGAVYPGKVTLEDVNIRPLPNPAWGGKGYGIDAHVAPLPATEFRLGSVWVETGLVERHLPQGPQGLARLSATRT